MKKSHTKRAAAHLKRLTRLVIGGAVAILVFGGAFYSYAATPPRVQPLPKAPAKITHHPIATKSTNDPTPKTTNSTPASTAPPVSTKPAPATKPVPKPAASTPSPTTVTPSPSSSVNNLTPTSTPAPTTQSSPDPTPSQTQNSSPITPAASYSSTNWSGYLSAGGYYTAVSATWVAPTVDATVTTESGDATWIGIGGVTGDDLIQIGTENIVEPNGQQFTGAFYELLPDVAQPVPGVTVQPGDTVTASISQVSATKWNIGITDQTSGQSYISTVTYTSTNSSAEWVEEDPSYASGGLVPFDNFGTVPFTRASTTVNGTAMDITDAQGSIITMLASPGHIIVAQPSAIGQDGASFSVTRKNVNQ